MSQIRSRGGALVLFPGALGDLLCFLPALEALRAQHRDRVHLVCKASLRGLAGLAGVASSEPIEGPLSAWMFSPSPPAEADAFFRGFTAIESFTGAGVPEVERNLTRWGNGRTHRFRGEDGVHVAVQWLRSVGVESSRLPVISLPRAAGVRPEGDLNSQPRLLVHPGSGGLEKRWSRAGFHTLIRRWRQTVGAARVVLGPAEADERASWAIDGVEPFLLEDVFDLVRAASGADVYLGNDSGASHLAAALGLPGAALFGPSDPARWAPLGERLTVLRPRPWTGLEDDPPAAVTREIERALAASSRIGSP